MTGDRAVDPAALDRLRELAGGDDDFVRELLTTYLEDAAGQLARMRVAAETGDQPALMMASHSLKSNSANVGALHLADLCRALEADSRAGAVPDAIDRVAQTEAVFATVEAELVELGAGS
jgi:HPt (histidine-containing phosphotransfer) domain-containing protein